MHAVAGLLIFGTLCSCASRPPLRAACEADSIPDAYSRAVGALFWPGSSRAFLVDEQGELSNGLWRLKFHVPGGAISNPRRVAYEERWRPVVHWTRRAGPVRWDFEAVAFPARSSDDSVLAVSVVAEATNLAHGPRLARLAATLDTLAAPAFVAADGDPPAPGVLRWSGAGEATRSLAFAERATPGPEALVAWSLPPGNRRRTRFLLATHILDPGEMRRIARVPHETRARSVRRFWTERVDAGTRFGLQDPELDAAIRAARVVLLACRERWHGVWLPIGGPFHYRDTWIRDGARLIRALAVHGYTAEARETARGIATLQWPNGAFLTQRGQLDGSGQALWSFEQAFLRPPGGEDLLALASQSVRCWRWSEGQRQLGRQSGWPLGRMLPFGEPRDNELVRAQLVGNDAWMLAGYAAASRLCGAAGLERDSMEIERSRRAYLADFQTALAGVASPDIPPSWQGNGRDWGNIVVPWPTLVLDPFDPRCERLARRLWQASDGPMMVYGSKDSLQSYVGADLGAWALLADRPEMADSVLTGLLHWRNACGAQAEFFSRSTRDFGANLPPHPTAAAALLSLVRDGLINDDSDTLRLTLGARTAWWRGGSVLGAPTRWGVLDLRFRHDGPMVAWEWTPVPVWTVLRLPPGFQTTGMLPAPVRSGPRPGSVLAPPGVGGVRLTVERVP